MTRYKIRCVGWSIGRSVEEVGLIMIMMIIIILIIIVDWLARWSVERWAPKILDQQFQIHHFQTSTILRSRFQAQI